MSDKHTPAFMFYPQDWDAGTQAMTLAQRGLYCSLLCYQWAHTYLPDPKDEEMYARICRCAVREIRRHWPAIQGKFIADDQGRLYNERLQVERERQKSFRTKQAKNGRAGGKASWQAGSKRFDGSTAIGATIPSGSTARRKPGRRVQKLHQGFQGLDELVGAK
jgi:uncharacterized protein YdaU (DUF1376 family)|tara:strand:+ start:202 stop:690 length:489 start_codon:yes stop_codon:yes gene_type:complete